VIDWSRLTIPQSLLQRAAEVIRLTIPQSLLARADEVIQ
jgi:hypothetical protein